MEKLNRSITVELEGQPYEVSTEFQDIERLERVVNTKELLFAIGLGQPVAFSTEVTFLHNCFAKAGYKGTRNDLGNLLRRDVSTSISLVSVILAEMYPGKVKAAEESGKTEAGEQ